MPLFFAESKDDFRQQSKSVADVRAGGFVTFTGSVRSINLKKPVDHLFYEAHTELASSLFLDLEHEAKNRFGIFHCQAVHRLGRVEVGDDAVMIAVCAPHRHEAFLANRFLIDELKKILPIWKKEVYHDGSFNFGDGLCACDEATKHFDRKMRPVLRALQARDFSYEKLKRAKVMLVGAGGLGCPLAINLSALGLASLSVYDGDVVENANLLRQFIFTGGDIGLSKARLLKRFIEERNSAIKVYAHEIFLDEKLANQHLKDFDLVIDATDSPVTKNMLKMVAKIARVPLISASVYQAEGEVSVYLPKDDEACLNCFTERVEENVIACTDAGVFTHVCSLVSSVASEKALSILAGSVVNQCEITLVDPINGFKTLAILRDDNCGVCGVKKHRSKKLVRLAR